MVVAQKDDDDDNNQPQPQFQILIDPDLNFDRDAPTGIQPAHDRDAESWLRRAAEAAQREDWKLVADTLERVIRDHGSSLIETDGAYRSAVQAAQQQIASLPPEGLAAYRILFDPTARRLVELAKQSHDLDALREVARVYPMTTQGPVAFDLLTAWLLDAMRSGEALAYLDQWAALPRTGAPPGEIDLRRAVAYLLSRRPDRARSILDGLPSDIDDAARRRAESLEAFMDSGATFSGDGSANSLSQAWKTRLGPFATAVAAPLEPIVMESTRRDALLPSSDQPNEQALHDVALGQARPPVWQVVSDGQRVYVSCPAGLVALDSANMDVLWQALPKSGQRDRRIVQQRQMVAGWPGVIEEFEDNPDTMLDDYTTETLFHEFAGAVTVSHGLVFTIDQARSELERNPSLDGVLRPQLFEGTLDSNSLMAYESDTGRLLWILGRGGPREHLLTDAHFYSTPIEYGDDLLVTYVRNGDLLLGVLDTRGNVVREVVIGAGRADLFPMYGILEPTIADGSVYVPSGAGMLTALHEHDLSLRWFSSYERESLQTTRSWRRGGFIMNAGVQAPADEWLSTPPIAVGGRVVLAPQDAAHLFVFDVENGKLLWSSPRGKNRYVVGADETRIVLAGESIEAVKLDDGSRIWAYENDVLLSGSGSATPLGSVDRMRPYGRPLIVGDRVLVPTINGILALDLETGEIVGDPLGEGTAFGNLRAFDGALYTVGHTAIAKYPDPVRAQSLALARLERDPMDVPAMLRLAWLAILRSDWAPAMEWLDRADEALAAQRAALPVDADSDRAALAESKDRVAHHRVTVLLAMADERDDAEREAMLERAFAAARLPADHASAGLALANQRFAMGRERNACLLCVQLLESSRGQPIALSPRWRVQDTIEIGRRLEQLLDRSSPDVRAAVAAALSELGDRLLEAGDTAALARIADAVGFLPISIAFDQSLAAIDVERGYTESALHHLDRAISRSDDRGLDLSLLLRIAYLHVAPPAGHAPNVVEARQAIRRLAGFDAGTPMPADSSDIATATGAGDVGAFIEWCTTRVPRLGAPPEPFVLRDGARLALIAEAFTIESDHPTLAASDVQCFWDPNRRYDIDDRVIPFFLADQYRGIEPAPLDAMPHRWIHEPQHVGADYDDQRLPAGPNDMAIAGRMAVLSRQTQIDAVGLDTGRAMWTPIPVAAHLGARPRPSVVTDGHVVVAATDPNTLVAAAARDGAEPLWRRSWPDRRLGRLFVIDGRLICVDAAAERAVVVDMNTGMLIREFALPVGPDTIETLPQRAVAAGANGFQATPDARFFARAGGSLIRATGSHLVARRATTGEVLWEAEIDGEVLGIEAPDDGYVAVYRQRDSQKAIQVMSGDSGEVVMSADAIGLELPPMDAVIERPRALGEPRLLLFTKLDDPMTVEFVLVSFPLALDALPDWRAELGTHAMVGPQMLRASPDYVAVVKNETSESHLDADGRKVLEIDPKVPPRLHFISKANGRQMGPAPYSFYEGQLGDRSARPNSDGLGQNDDRHLHKSRRVTDVVVLNRRIVVFAPEGCYILADKSEVASNDP